MEKNNKILTEGNIYKSLLMFAIPFLIANFIQALYGAVDMAIVGWFGSSISISAVSIGSQVMQILTSLISGLTMGGTILIAQYFGAEKEKDTVETISTMLTLFVGFAILFTIVMMFLTPSFLKMLRTPVEAFSGAKEYVLICSAGIIFIFGYNGISAMLRGIGDSKSPMIFIAIACITNIVLDLILVGKFKLGPSGAAIATIASQGVSVVLAIIYLSKRNFIFQFKFKNFKIHKDKALKLIKLGIPVSLQETMVSVSFLIITAIINTLGVVPAAAVGIASKFDMFAMLPAIAFSGAITSITAQNIGANKPERAKKALNASMLLAFLCSIVFFAWAQINAQSIMHMFKADVDVTLAGSQYMRTFSIDFMLVAFGFCQNGFLNGCGRTKFTMINGILASILIRVPLAYILSVYIPTSLLGIGLAAPIATFISVTISFVYIKSGRWNKI
ncbi:MATE family efflux transporter [Clostridium senegalense]|uniref:MATE family efflux transporter n=1 Tax=Clostridium senegalense TaxID=1465809 RepID=UPI001C105417|nr:MATE family efflux transporter [Clostridium senegalense]MBU5228222.1 MATE family efflux transporter [Clostridium senegalense]